MPVEFNRFALIGEQALPRAEAQVMKAAIDVEALAKEKAPYWLGSLENSIQTAPGVAPLTARVNVASDYGASVEYGAKAHWLPKAAIEGELAAWAAAHGMAGAEWAIAHKISVDGTPAQPFLTPSVEEVAATTPFNMRKIVGIE